MFSISLGLNIISEFNLENTTTYSTTDEVFSDLTTEKEDITEEGEITSNNQRYILLNFIVICASIAIFSSSFIFE